MAIDVKTFRANFAEFTSTTAYPDGAVSMWLAFAYTFLAPNRWGVALDLGAQLYTAHNLVLERMAVAEGANGAPPGTFTGPIASKSVGDLTISYDPALGVNKEDGHWGLTHYGTRFIKFARQFGSGPVQTRPGAAPIGQGGFFIGIGGQPWPGPLFNVLSDP